MQQTDVTVTVNQAARFLLAGVAALTLASLFSHLAQFHLGLGPLGGVVPMLDATQEGNVPTWLSSMGLLACGLLVAWIAAARRRMPQSEAWRPLVALSAVLLLAVLLLAALDEGAAIHERAGGVLGERLGTPLQYPWIVPGAVIAVPVVAYLGRWVGRLPDGVRGLAIGATSLLLAGALGLEVVESTIASSRVQSGTATEQAVAVVEEAMERMLIPVSAKQRDKVLEHRRAVPAVNRGLHPVGGANAVALPGHLGERSTASRTTARSPCAQPRPALASIR